jgi:hypothetical protein
MWQIQQSQVCQPLLSMHGMRTLGVLDRHHQLTLDQQIDAIRPRHDNAIKCQINRQFARDPQALAQQHLLEQHTVARFEQAWTEMLVDADGAVDDEG